MTTKVNHTEVNFTKKGDGCKINQSKESNSNSIINNKNQSKLKKIDNQKSDNIVVTKNGNGLKNKTKEVTKVISKMNNNLTKVMESHSENLSSDVSDEVLTLNDFIEEITDDFLSSNEKESIKKVSKKMTKIIDNQIESTDSEIYDEDWLLSDDTDDTDNVSDNKETKKNTLKKKVSKITNGKNKPKSHKKSVNKVVKKVKTETVTKVKTEVGVRNIEDLTIHPIHSQLYGDNEKIDDIKLSMKKDKQSLTPIIITKNNEIVSGVRRYLCYKEMKLKTIEVIVKDIKSEDILLTIIHSNLQRKNSCIQTLNIYDSLMEFFSHQGKKTSESDKTEVNTLSRNKVCKMIGYSYPNIIKLKNIKDINPNLLRLIDEGKKTINRVSKMCGKKKIDTVSEIKVDDKLNPTFNQLFSVRQSTEFSLLKENKIQCIVTTPPKYNGDTEVKEYINNLVNCFDKCFKVLKSDGSLYLIMNDYRNDSGIMSNIPHLLLFRLIDLGFHHIDTILWEYSTPLTIGVNNKNLIPSYKYIFHLTKELNYYINEVGRNIRKTFIPKDTNGKTEMYDKYRFYKGKEWNKEWITENIIKTNKTKVVDNNQPSSILETIPIGLILDSTKEGDVVLNPFDNDESVGLVSLFYNRRFYGFTDNEEYSKIQSQKFNRFLNEYKKVS